MSNIILFKGQTFTFASPHLGLIYNHKPLIPFIKNQKFSETHFSDGVGVFKLLGVGSVWENWTPRTKDEYMMCSKNVNATGCKSFAYVTDPLTDVELLNTTTGNNSDAPFCVCSHNPSIITVCRLLNVSVSNSWRVPPVLSCHRNVNVSF